MRKPETIGFWSGRLPHWEVEEGRYFVTIHTAGAIPEKGKAEIMRMRRQLEHLKDIEQFNQLRKIFIEMEKWLHEVKINAWLEQPHIANVIVQSLRHYETLGYWKLFSFVVMPNHVHLFLEIHKRTLKENLLAWKRWAGREGKKLSNCFIHRFWQREWFDHWSRSDEQDDRISKYIRMNPVKAGLVNQPEDWKYGSWSK